MPAAPPAAALSFTLALGWLGSSASHLAAETSGRSAAVICCSHLLVQNGQASF